MSDDGPPPAKLRLIDTNRNAVDTNTLPEVGAKTPAGSLPVVLAKGATLERTFIPVPQLNTNSLQDLANTAVLVVAANSDRRYLKIINNGANDVELWLDTPNVNEVGQLIPQGEVLFANGGGLLETDTCRTTAVYATCKNGPSGLMVLEG